MSQYGNIRTVNCRLSLCVHTHRVCIHRRTDGSIHAGIFHYINLFYPFKRYLGVVPSKEWYLRYLQGSGHERGVPGRN